MLTRFLLPWLCLALAACEARVNVELGTADLDGASAVRVALEGVDLLDQNGELHTLDHGSDTVLDLRDLIDGQSLALVDSTEVEATRYTGIRLRFADSGHRIELEDGTEAALTIDSTADFADLDVDIGEDETATVLATLDLRFSLQRDSASGTYTLTPVLRAIDADSAASLTGIVDAAAVEAASCRQGRDAGAGVAVYLFDRDAASLIDYRRDRSGPIASARVQSIGSSYSYDLANLAAGAYTLAWTCEADTDAPDADNGLSFRSSVLITLAAGEAQVIDF